MLKIERKKVFIYGSSAGLGDALMLLPSLLELCKNDKFKITISLTHRTRHLKEVLNFYLNLVPNNLIFKTISVENGFIGRLKYFLKLRNERFDYVYFPTSKSKLKTLLVLLIIMPKFLFVCIKYILLDPQNNEHKISYYSRKLGLNFSKTQSENISYNLRITSHALYSKPEIPTKTDHVIIAPGGGVLELHKRWPISKFIDLIVNLKMKKNLNSILLGGTDQLELLKEIQKKCNVKGVNCILSHPKSILESISILNSSKCLISSCSSAIHMGSLTGIKIIGLYGPTDFKFTGPWNDSFEIKSITCHCGPATKTYFGRDKPLCMNKITVESVFETVSMLYE